MNKPETVTEAVLCLNCADRLTSAGYVAEEQSASGHGVGKCELCAARGFFSRYRCYKRRSQRREDGG